MVRVAGVNAVVVSLTRLGEHSIGFHNTDHRTDLATQVEVGNYCAIGEAQPVQFGYAEHICGSSLLTSAQCCNFVSRHGVVRATSLTIGGEAVHNFMTFGDPCRNSSASTKIDIIGVRGNYQNFHCERIPGEKLWGDLGVQAGYLTLSRRSLSEAVIDGCSWFSDPLPSRIRRKIPALQA